MPEGASKSQREAVELPSEKKELADIIAETKRASEKKESPQKIQIPSNFLKEIENRLSPLKNIENNTDSLNKNAIKIDKKITTLNTSINTFLKKILALQDKKESKKEIAKPSAKKIKEKDSEEIKTLNKEKKELQQLLNDSRASAKSSTIVDDTTGEESVAALKKTEPQPVTLVEIDDKALKSLKKIFDTIGIQASPSKVIAPPVASGSNADKDSILTKIFGNKLTPLLTGLGASLALAVSSWFDSGPFKGLMKELGKLGTNIFATKVVAQATKLFPALVKFIKPIARRLPVIGTIIDFGSAISRILQGDFIGGAIDLASGIANLVPGIGTAISIGLGFINAARDLSGQTEDAKAGKANKEGNVFALITQSVVKWGAKLLPKLKFLPIIGSLFSFASAVNHFKTGKVIQGMLDTVAGIAGFFPGAGTVISLLTTGVSLIMDLFEGDKSENKDPEKTLDVPKGAGGGSLLTRLNKFLSDKFKDVMKGALQFLKKLPFVPDFVIEKVSKYLGIDGEGEASASGGVAATPTSSTPPSESESPALDRIDAYAKTLKPTTALDKRFAMEDSIAEEIAARRAPEKLEEMRRVRGQEKIAETPEFINDQVKASKKDLPKAKDGGIFTGPIEGYPVELHGTEAVVPVKSNSELTKDSITAIQQNAQLDAPSTEKQNEYSMTYLVGLLKEFVSEDNKDRYDSKDYERLKTNIKWFEQQLKSRKEINESMKKILYEDAMRASMLGEGKKAGFQAKGLSDDAKDSLKYESFKQKYKIVNDWKNNKDTNWSSINPVYNKNTEASKKARFGGIFTGSEDGYNVTLHGKEAVIPLQANTNSRVPLEAPLTQLPGMPGSNIIEKLEELIQTVKEQSQNQSVSNASSVGVNAVAGGNSVTNIFQNSAERDIPYLERNKYREQFVYNRGLI